MKPELYIIGIGAAPLDKLSLGTFKILKGAKVIYVWSSRHPVVKDMSDEGLTYVDLEQRIEAISDLGKLESVAREITASDINHREYAVLALPGLPIREGKIVRELHTLLDDRFNVRTELLASESSLARLKGIMRELRLEWGCPWDKEQTHDSLKKYLIEETYEVIDAIDSGNMNNLAEELGDLLLQVVFHSQIAEEAEQFNLPDVIKGISDKLIRRHPHVFDSVVAETSAEVLVNWEAIKKSEKEIDIEKEHKANTQSDFFNIPKGLPALQMAEKTQNKASKVGFDWDDYKGPLAKIYEELSELEKEIQSKQRIADELGDLLFSIVNLSRFLGVNAEESLRQGTKKFQSRFRRMLCKIQEKGHQIEELSLKEIDFYWNKVKNEEKDGTLGSF